MDLISRVLKIETCPLGCISDCVKMNWAQPIQSGFSIGVVGATKKYAVGNRVKEDTEVTRKLVIGLNILPFVLMHLLNKYSVYLNSDPGLVDDDLDSWMTVYCLQPPSDKGREA